jgi:hypothetical protein
MKHGFFIVRLGTVFAQERLDDDGRLRSEDRGGTTMTGKGTAPLLSLSCLDAVVPRDPAQSRFPEQFFS